MKQSFRAKLDNFRREDDSRFLTARVIVAHDGLNLNGSEFSKEDLLKCAEASLRECPILGSVVTDEETGEKRLNGHDMDYVLTEENGEYGVDIRHIERIYGFIPHDAPIEMQFIDDKYYLITSCALWRNYLDEVEDILFKQDGVCDVSMEIEALETYVNGSGNLQITNFNFLGITMLNDSPAMKGANLKLANFSMKDIKSELKEMIKVYAMEQEGGEIMEEEKVQEEVVVTKEEVETVAVDGEVVEEEIKVSEENIIRDAEDPIDCEPEMPMDDDYACGDKKKKKCYDDDEEDKKEDDEFACGDKKKKKYDDDDEYACGDKKKKKYEELEEEFSALQQAYAELQAKLDSMADYEELKAFKDAYDTAAYEKEVEEVSNMFPLAEEEYSELKEKVMNREISLEQYKEKLGFKFAMKQISNKKFSKEEKVSSEISVMSIKEEKSNAPYGGKFEKFRTKK